MTSSASNDATNDQMPAFVVIGAQKSASTFLQDQMAQHPDDRDRRGRGPLLRGPLLQRRGRRSRCRRCSTGPRPARCAASSGPTTSAAPRSPPGCAQHLPEATAVRGGPRARGARRLGVLPLRPARLPAAAADRRGVRGLARRGRSRRTTRGRPEILEYGLYGKHLRHYAEHFARDRIMVFEQKGLTGDPAGSLRTAFEFIGVDPGLRAVDDRVGVEQGRLLPRPAAAAAHQEQVRLSTTPRTSTAATRASRVPSGWTYNAGVVALDRLVLSRFDSGRPPALSPALRGARRGVLRGRPRGARRGPGRMPARRPPGSEARRRGPPSAAARRRGAPAPGARHQVAQMQPAPVGVAVAHEQHGGQQRRDHERRSGRSDQPPQPATAGRAEADGEQDRRRSGPARAGSG